MLFDEPIYLGLATSDISILLLYKMYCDIPQPYHSGENLIFISWHWFFHFSHVFSLKQRKFWRSEKSDRKLKYYDFAKIKKYPEDII